MSNLTTTLLGDIRNRQIVYLPAGKAKFNWIDVENIGEAVAILFKNFESVVKLMNQATLGKIRYVDANPISYFVAKRREGIPRGLILVVILIHFLPRFQEEPRISDFYERLPGKKPTTLKEFLEREKAKLAS